MRYLPAALAAFLLAAPAYAEEAPPKTLVVDSGQLLTLLGGFNYAKFPDLKYPEMEQITVAVMGMKACASMQVPQNGVTTDRGQCPSVSAALKAQSDAVAAAREAQKAEDAKAPSPVAKP